MKRFLDDIFMILECEGINDLDAYLNNMLIHRYLKFTFEHSFNTVNFLDVTISLGSNNFLCTTIYSKPMSRHQYLHSKSNHPPHLKNSLFYSQGLRAIRICSDRNDCENILQNMYNKFVTRGYNICKLNETLVKLLQISRDIVLCPKGAMLQKYLAVHNPEILVKYNAIQPDKELPANINTTTYAIFPFYNCVNMYKQLVEENIVSHIVEQIAFSNSAWSVEQSRIIHNF